MAIGLGDALLGWLVESAGDRLASWLRGDPARVAMLHVIEMAVDETVDEVADGLASDAAEHLRDALLVYKPGVDGDPAQVTSATELREALHAWTRALDHPEFGEPGYLSQLGVDPRRLADTLAYRIIAGIKLDGRCGGALSSLAEWLWRDDNSVRLTRIEEKIEATAPPQELFGGGLPGGTPDFTGRQQVLAELAARVETHDPAGIVVAIHSIDGMAGIGKTELALRAAHQHKHRYPDGQYFINLHGYTDGTPPMPPETALEELLRQAGVPGQAIPFDLAGRQARWQASMANRRALVVLDNALDAEQVRPLLANATGCLVLITSRTRLRGLPGAKAFPLDVPTPDEAVELFVRLANIGRQLDLDAVARIVELVGRLPMAVQAVAGQVDATCTEAELADELAEAKAELGLVDDAGPLGAGVRAAFETSLQRLIQTHRNGFLALGLAPGPSVSVDQFAALAGLPDARARSTLRSLAERNLVKPARDPFGHLRYEMHDLMRAFARQQAESHLSIDERSAALARFTHSYTTVIDTHESLWNSALGTEPDRYVWEYLTNPSKTDDSERDESRAWLAAEQGNLRALARVVASEDAAHVYVRFASLLTKVGRIVYIYESDRTAPELLRAACDIYHRTGNRTSEADALLELGALTLSTPNARDYYHRALTIYQQTGNRAGEATALVALGSYETAVNEELACDYYRRAQTIYQQIGNRAGAVKALLNLCEIPSHAGDARPEELRQALTIYEQAGDLAGQARTLHRLSGAAWATGNHPVASEYLHRALRIHRQTGAWRREADTLQDLGDAVIVQGRRDEASSYYQRAHAIYVERSDAGDSRDAAEARAIQEDIDRINAGDLPRGLYYRLIFDR